MAVLSSIDSHREEMLNLWRKLVEIEGDITNKAGTDQIARTISDLLANWEVPSSIISMERRGTPSPPNGASAIRKPPGLADGAYGHRLPQRYTGGNPLPDRGQQGHMGRRAGHEGRTGDRALRAARVDGRGIRPPGPSRIAFSGDEEGGHQYTCERSESCLRPARKAAGRLQL